MTTLLQKGYHVSIPFGEYEYDLIVDDGVELHRVQVKTARVNGDSIIFETRSRVHTYENVDQFGVYCPEFDTVYLVPFEATPKNNMSLRIDNPHADSTPAHIFEV